MKSLLFSDIIGLYVWEQMDGKFIKNYMVFYEN